MRRRVTLAFATVALGVAAAAVAPPALAATTPTISVPPSVTGYAEITISGTAGAGAIVSLYESAYNWNDLQVATDWDTGEPITAKADSAGRYALRRYVDTGFLFAVEADGERSRTATVHMKVLPVLTLASTSSGTVSVHVAPSPDQPWLPVDIERQSGSGWTKVAGGYTDDTGSYDATLTGQGAGTTRTYRAYVGGDTETAITANRSAPKTVTVVGSGGSGSTPGVGDVQFTKIQYDGPSGLNNEWVRLTNKTSRTLNLQGTSVRDAAGNTYAFSGSYLLGAGTNVYLHTGAGTDGSPGQHRYWGRTGYVWNNGGDTATLRRGSTTIDSCRWTGNKGVTYC
jgi:Lamin Tail Domain